MVIWAKATYKDTIKMADEFPDSNENTEKLVGVTALIMTHLLSIGALLALAPYKSLNVLISVKYTIVFVLIASTIVLGVQIQLTRSIDIHEEVQRTYTQLSGVLTMAIWRACTFLFSFYLGTAPGVNVGNIIQAITLTPLWYWVGYLLE
ncbi:hypothetical protein F5Y11DRAFT_37453 [Daldinia sp. FL1419]|nr:hypothetical protein F5Y11DRAFT_37453 [Daldinia sp. FL1419]